MNIVANSSNSPLEIPVTLVSTLAADTIADQHDQGGFGTSSDSSPRQNQPSRARAVRSSARALRGIPELDSPMAG